MLVTSLITAMILPLASAVVVPRKVCARRAGSKAGFSWPIQEGSVAPVAEFFGQGSKLTWWYNWNKNYDIKLFPKDAPKKPTINAEFVPMIYQPDFLSNENPLEVGWKAVMGYNEPDLHGSMGESQPLEPSVAAEKWKTLVAEIKKQNPSAEIWSPAIAFDKDWTKRFLAAICPGGVAGCDVAPNYLNVHVYAKNLEKFQKQVNDWHDQFGMNLVLTEFAYDVLGANSEGPEPTPEKASAFMKEVIPWLDNTSYIHRYAWFGAVRDEKNLVAVHPANKLMDATGKLTPLGKQYVGGGT